MHARVARRTVVPPVATCMGASPHQRKRCTMLPAVRPPHAAFAHPRIEFQYCTTCRRCTSQMGDTTNTNMPPSSPRSAPARPASH